MALMRRLFLWASRQRWLGEQMTRRRFARRAVRRFLPGEDIEAALGAARDLKPRRIATVLTELGENISGIEEARAVAAHYQEVLAQIAPTGLDAQISVKLTHLGLDIGVDEAAALVLALAQRAADAGNFVWIDMEDSSYVDATLEVYRRVRTALPNVGVCLQSYLHRTPRDLEALVPLGPSIRLVKGAYNEPPSVALASKRDVDEAYFRLARTLLQSVAGKHGSRVGFGTHDMGLIGRVQEAAQALGVSRDAFEVQMLYGIRRADQERLANDGYRVRVLVSYGAYWFPWYMRRLAERPANAWFVIKSLFG